MAAFPLAASGVVALVAQPSVLALLVEREFVQAVAPVGAVAVLRALVVPVGRPLAAVGAVAEVVGRLGFRGLLLSVGSLLLVLVRRLLVFPRERTVSAED